MREKVIGVVSIVLVIAAVVFSYFLEQYIRPGYFVKSVIKVASFGGIICLYTLVSGKRIFDVIGLHKTVKIVKLAGALALFIVGGVVIFFIFKNLINWDSIRNTLTSREGLTKENCIIVYFYIVVVNSFLEEAFFRGFIPGLFTKKKIGYCLSAVLFSGYHIGIIGNWFNLPLFILCVVGLFLVGLFLQFLSVKFETIAAGWMVHASGNLVINAIGVFLIFGML